MFHGGVVSTLSVHGEDGGDGEGRDVRGSAGSKSCWLPRCLSDITKGGLILTEMSSQLSPPPPTSGQERCRLMRSEDDTDESHRGCIRRSRARKIRSDTSVLPKVGGDF